MNLAVARIAPRTGVLAGLPALKLEFLRTVLKVVRRMAWTHEFIPPVGARLRRNVEPRDAHGFEVGTTAICSVGKIAATSFPRRPAAGARTVFLYKGSQVFWIECSNALQIYLIRGRRCFVPRRLVAMIIQAVVGKLIMRLDA